jgi:HD-GYP domain-containing protein (c-di-GMP phosphodiesterase class II)
VEDIDRGRLIQERWFTAIRWLMVEALFLQIHPELELPRFIERQAGLVFSAFALYTLLLTILVIARKRWPPYLAYLTAAVDTIFAAFVAATWAPAVLTPGLIGVGASGIAIGARRFHIVDTFVYALFVEAALIGAYYVVHQYAPSDPFDYLIITAFALLPVLSRAIALVPNPKSEDLVFQRLDEGTTRVTGGLPSEGESTDDVLFPPAATALAEYSDSQLGGIIVQKSDDHADLYTVHNGQISTDQLAVPSQDQLAARLLAVREPTILTRRDNLATAGLPDQFPTRLENLIVTPLKNVGTKGAALFAANRRGGGYRVEDRIIATLLGSEVARLKLAHDFAVDSSQALLAASDALLAAAEAKRPGSRTQAEESARFAIAIAREIGWKDNALEDIALAALLHDVGEIAIPDYLLEKTDQLTPEEFEIVKQHPRIAAKIIDPLNRSKLVLSSIYAHHERWDGRGYPGGLAGEDIPEGARILALAHSMDAMLSPKPYRAPLTPPEALQEIILGSGTQFDPSTVQAFLAVLKREGESFLQRREAPESAQKTDWTGFRA